MRPRNLTPFLFGAKVTSRQPPRPEMTMIVRGSFTLRAGEPVTPLEGLMGGLLEQGPLTGEVFAEEDEDRVGECLYPGDFADYKPHAEVFLVGSCHPVGGLPVRECAVRFAVGAWFKSLRVVGNRRWEARGASVPQPFETMPLGWANSFGGPGFARNPCGKGVGTPELPNVESPFAHVRSAADRPEPAGFGPLNPSWPQRAGKMGTQYGGASYKKRAPFYAEDFDWTHFQAALRDQWLPGFLRGDEEVFLESLHPASSRFSTLLPGLRIRAFSKDAEGATHEARMNLDTLLVDVPASKLVLTWRGHVPCHEIDLSDVKTVLIASEKLGDEPLPPEHYQALLDAFHADPIGVLTDELMPGARKTRAAVEAAAKGLPDNPEGSPAGLALAVLGNDDLMTLGVPEEERPAALARAAGAAAQIRDATAKEQEAIAAATAKLPEGAKLPSSRAPTMTANERAEEAPDVRAQVTKAVTDAVREARARAEKAGAPLSLPQLAELEKLQDRLADPTFQKGLAMATPPRAAEIGPGRDLSSRDMTGRDFSGLDLSGANLEGAVLSGARLVGTRLAGANLRQAVLQGADLSGADLSGADLTRTLLNDVKATDADFRRARFELTLLAKASLKGAKFDDAKAQMTLLSEADLTGARFHRAELSRVFADSAGLEGADFSDARVEKCTFMRCRASGASFARAVLTNTSFMESVLRAAIFYKASGKATNFMRADLADADFRLVALHDAHFMETKAVGTRFFGADLRGSELIRACLDRADFERANLLGANLSGAKLSATRFVDASLFQARLTGTTQEDADADFEGANVKEAILPS